MIQIRTLLYSVSVGFLEIRFKFSVDSFFPRATMNFFAFVRHGTCHSRNFADFGPLSDSRRHGGQSKEKDQKWPQHFSSFKNGPLPKISNWKDKRTLRDTGWKWTEERKVKNISTQWLLSWVSLASWVTGSAYSVVELTRAPQRLST